MVAFHYPFVSKSTASEILKSSIFIQTILKDNFIYWALGFTKSLWSKLHFLLVNLLESTNVAY